jgi:hypothetical protein
MDGRVVQGGGIVVNASGLNITGGLTARDVGVTIESGDAMVTQGGAVVRDVGMRIGQGQVRTSRASTMPRALVVLLAAAAPRVRTKSGWIVAVAGRASRRHDYLRWARPRRHGPHRRWFAVFNGSAQVLADGVNVSGGLTIVTDGMLLDGRSLRYVRRTFLIAESMHTPPASLYSRI